MTTRVPRSVVALSLIASAIVIVQLARLSVYMVDPAATGWSVMPWNDFATRHNCLTGYWAAARTVDAEPNVWGDDLTSTPGPTPESRVAKALGGFNVDQYEYTPTFLLLPRALTHVTPDFLRVRLLWFVLNVALVVAAIVALARRLAPALGPAVLWLAPLTLVPLSVLGTFQAGNLQLACIAGSLLAMLWFERARGSAHPVWLRLAAGLLLAFMTVSKLYPGMLVVYLLLRRDWIAVAWTGTFAIGLALLGLADVGLPAHVAFLDHLPRLLSGESFPNLRHPGGIAANLSIPGLVRKLSLYGLPYSSFGAMRVAGSIYTVILLGIVARLAWRPVPAPVEPIAWIVIVLLATLRSPVLPVYGVFPIVWLLAIVLAARWTAAGMRWGLLAWFAMLAMLTPSWTLWPPTVHAVFTTVVQTAGSLALAAGAVRQASRYRDLGAAAR